MPHSYTLYDLTVVSELELPAQPLPTTEAGAGVGAGAVDVDIRFGDIGDEVFAACRQIGPFVFTAPGRMVMQVPDIANYWVEGGARIVIEPAPDSDQDSIRTFLLGSAFGALLMQRGLTVLHGNAINVDGEVLICVGESGAGKSTLAACMERRGYPVLSDDVAALDEDLNVLPGLPHIKLWQDAADTFGVDTDGLPLVRPLLEKFLTPMINPLRTPAPAGHIYALHLHGHGHIAMRPLLGLERFRMLSKQIYRPKMLHGMGLSQQHLKHSARLVDRVHMVQVERPDGGQSAEALADAILADMRAAADDAPPGNAG